MRSFDEAISARVVAGNADMANVITFCEIIDGFNVGRTIVGDDVGKRAPSA